jgi:hypothetical protein
MQVQSRTALDAALSFEKLSDGSSFSHRESHLVPFSYHCFAFRYEHLQKSKFRTTIPQSVSLGLQTRVSINPVATMFNRRPMLIVIHLVQTCRNTTAI